MGDTEQSEQLEDTEHQLLSELQLGGSSKKQLGNRPTVTKSHFLPAPGLPTLSNKLAQKIWDLEFVEMEEFLPSNRMIQAIENPVSLQEGIVGALQQLQQPGGGHSHMDPLFLSVYFGNGSKTS